MFYDEDDINYYNKQSDEVEKFIINKKIININESEIKIGDKIVIYFTPYSQKYIYTVYPKYGEVIEDSNDPYQEFSLMNIIIKNDKQIYNAYHEELGLYGRCYDYKIIKLI
jgi:hypothetical protein